MLDLLREKSEIVASLLLRAGVPANLISRDNRVVAVLDNAIAYTQRPQGQTLHKYDIGRQFIIRGGVREANRAAEIVLPLLLAENSGDLAIRATEAEHQIETEVLSNNVPGPTATPPRR
jgi:hypothetical protein